MASLNFFGEAPQDDYLLFGGQPSMTGAELQSLKRKKAITNALIAQSLQPLQLPQNYGALASPVSPFQVVAQLAKAYLGTKGMAEQDQATKELAQRYQEGEKGALESFLKKSSPGAPEYIPSTATGPIEGAASPTALPGVTAQTPGRPIEASMEAFMSDYPRMQQLGATTLQSLLKDRMTTKDWLSLADKFDPDSVKTAAMGGGLPALGAKTEFKAVGNELVPVRGSKVGQSTYFGPEYETNPDGTTKIYRVPVEGKTGPEPFIKELRSNKLVQMSTAPRITQTQNVANKQEGAFAGAIGPEDAKRLTAETQAARAAVRHLGTIAQMRDALTESFTGPGASIERYWARLSDKFGIGGKDTKERLAATAQLVQGMAKANVDAAVLFNGQGQISDSERVLIAETAAGNFGNSPAEIQARLDALDKVARLRIRDQQELLGQIKMDYPEASLKSHEIATPPPYSRTSAYERYKSQSREHTAPPVKGLPALDEFEQYRRR